MLRIACATVFLLTLIAAPCAQIHAQTLWTEDAENGLTYITDRTDPGYSLIQSGLVSEGSNAFHLATPDFREDNWFVIDQDLTIQSDTKLFFQSQLSWAANSQVAKVQISTNGGVSWPTDIYSQAGTGDAGEGVFGLREIDLSSYVNQDLRFRFYYDSTSNYGFDQTDIGVGWHIDDIQIGSELIKTQYSIGNPSADAQLYLEYINRARADAILEANRLASVTDSDVLTSYSNWGIDTQDIVDQFAWSVNSGVIDQVAQPLAFNAALNTAAELHTQDMFDNQFQGHESSISPPSPFMAGYTLSQRVNATDYDWRNLGENVFAHAKSVEHGHAGFDVDWGNTTNTSNTNYNPDFAGQGMQNPAGHRLGIHNDTFKEVGIGVQNGTNGSVGPQVVTQDFGNPVDDVIFITGVVFEDLDGDNFYDIGEGRSGVRVDVDGSGFFAISTDSGGYTVPVSGDGAYDVLFSGGGFADYMTVANVTNGKNVKVDYLAQALTLLANFDNDNDVDGDDLAILKNWYGVDGTADTDGDNDTDGADFLVWQREFTGSLPLGAVATVPEPSSVMLMVAGMMILAKVR